jgi:UDP-N-acetylglucosamine 2-epimerase (non-hydrolysing)
VSIFPRAAAHFVGARPNFPKMSPVYTALKSVFDSQVVVHTGQHYDQKLSDTFFAELEIPEPVVNFGVGSGRESQQIAKVLEETDKFLSGKRFDAIFVYGDVYSAVGAALAGFKNEIPVVHVESGLRSGDLTMPEEINRILVDRCSTIRLATSQDGVDNLRQEGILDESIFLVGNTMIDTLHKYVSRAKEIPQTYIHGSIQKYALVTLHRPSNVNNLVQFTAIWKQLNLLAESIQVIFPMHPRTKSLLRDVGEIHPNISIVEPLSYLNFVNCMINSSFVLTDSGGIQEETSYLNIPCFTLRNNTERPITITLGSNILVGIDDIPTLPTRPRKVAKPIPFWDGNASTRIASVMSSFLESPKE